MVAALQHWSLFHAKITLLGPVVKKCIKADARSGINKNIGRPKSNGYAVG